MARGTGELISSGAQARPGPDWLPGRRVGCRVNPGPWKITTPAGDQLESPAEIADRDYFQDLTVTRVIAVDLPGALADCGLNDAALGAVLTWHLSLTNLRGSSAAPTPQRRRPDSHHSGQSWRSSPNPVRSLNRSPPSAYVRGPSGIIVMLAEEMKMS